MTPQELVNMLGGLTLFADLSRPQLEQVAEYIWRSWRP